MSIGSIMSSPILFTDRRMFCLLTLLDLTLNCQYFVSVLHFLAQPCLHFETLLIILMFISTPVVYRPNYEALRNLVLPHTKTVTVERVTTFWRIVFHRGHSTHLAVWFC